MSEDAQTPTTTYDDGNFVRTAIVVDRAGGSFDLVAADGTRLAEINVFTYPHQRPEDAPADHVIVDVIDVDDKWTKRTALTFPDGQRQFHETHKVTSVEFRKGE